LRKKSGQSTMEYAIIFVAILIAFLFIQTYVRRAVQGRLRGASDDVGEQFSVAGTMNYRVTRNTKTTENSAADGSTTTSFSKDSMSKSGQEKTAAYNEEPWKY
ncbi:MAG: hypothetical protein V1674_06545, partial [Candidatus Omnitrophota bacterium]